MTDLTAKLRAVAVQLREIASEHAQLKFTASEEAMTWPLSIVVEDDGTVGLWCAKEDCTLDCENAQFDIDLENFSIGHLLAQVADHIAYDKERRPSYE